MNELVEALQSFGMTRQESNVYLYLYQNSKSTGYEIAKMTGISRSNVYSTLANLVEKGAVYSVEGAATKYVAVSIREFCENHFLHLKQNMEILKEYIPVKKTKEEEGYITIQGYINIIDKLRVMIKSTRKRVYFAASFEIIKIFEKELVDLCNTGKKVVLITNNGLNELLQQTFEEQGCIIYKRKNSDVQFKFVSDSSHVLTGELDSTQMDTGLYSCQINFVKFFKEAMRNEIRLIELENENKETDNS